jgi:hypothetical protein
LLALANLCEIFKIVKFSSILVPQLFLMRCDLSVYIFLSHRRQTTLFVCDSSTALSDMSDSSNPRIQTAENSDDLSFEMGFCGMIFGPEVHSPPSAATVMRLLSEKTTSTQLFGLDAISPVRSWNYTLPTLTQSNFADRKPWNEDCHFKDALHDRCPILKTVSLRNLALVGGAPACILLGIAPADYNFFVIVDDEDADEEWVGRQRAEEFIDDIYTFMKRANAAIMSGYLPNKDKLYGIDSFKVQRHHDVFTVFVSCPATANGLYASRSVAKIQIYCKAFKSTTHCLQMTDIGATAVAYYDGVVVFSEIGKFSIENMAIIVDLERQHSSFVGRLIKYFDRGFDIIMPHLNIAKVRVGNFRFGLSEVLDLPHLHAHITGIKDNKLLTTEIKAPQDQPPSQPVQGNTKPTKIQCLDYFADYNRANFGSKSMASTSLSDWNVGAKIHHNILQLINGSFGSFVFYGEGALYRDAFAATPLLTERMILNSYETVRRDVYADQSVDFAKMQFFTCHSAAQIAEMLFTNYFQRAAAAGNGAQRNNVFGKPMQVHIAAVLDQLVEQQVAHTKHLVLNLAALMSAYQAPVKSHASLSLESWYGPYFQNV